LFHFISALFFFRPVCIRDFRGWVERSSSDSDFRFAEEFEVKTYSFFSLYFFASVHFVLPLYDLSFNDKSPYHVTKIDVVSQIVYKVVFDV